MNRINKENVYVYIHREQVCMYQILFKQKKKRKIPCYINSSDDIW